MKLIGLAIATVSLAACQPSPGEGPKVSTDSVLACQNAVVQRGGVPQGAGFEQVDVQPGAAVAIKGYVVVDGQRAAFTCTLDGAGQVSGVTLNGQPR